MKRACFEEAAIVGDLAGMLRLRCHRLGPKPRVEGGKRGSDKDVVLQKMRAATQTLDRLPISPSRKEERMRRRWERRNDTQVNGEPMLSNR